jgi:hypothetical protein
MANAMPALSPLWRNSLRTWLAATLTIGILVWADRSKVMLLGLLMVVVFINDNDLTPLRSIGQMVAGSVIGILTAVVLHNLISGWVVTAIGLLITGVLVRGLGLLKGLSLGYLSCWGLEVTGDGVHFNAALVVDLAFSAVVGIAMAQLATWVFWPRRPLQTDGRLGPALHNLKLQLQAEAPMAPASAGPAVNDWLQMARSNNASAPLILAIAQQLEQLQQLLRSRALVRQAIERERSRTA